MTNRSAISEQPHNSSHQPLKIPTIHTREAQSSHRSIGRYSSNGGGDRRRRRQGGGADAAGVLDEPVRAAGAVRSEPQGRPLRVRGGGPVRRAGLEPAPPRLQPGPRREGARAHPRRPPRRRVAGHPGVHRRGVPGAPPAPARRPARPRRRPVLGGLRRPEAAPHVGPALRREDGRGAGGGGEGGRRRAGGVRGGARGQGLLRRGRRGAGGRGARRVPRVATRVRGHVRRAHRRPGQDAAAGGVGGAVRRAGRREGDRAGRGAAGGVQPHEAGSPRPAVSAAASDAVKKNRW
ncbi:hypothetical protein ACQJBY_026211 [Aegilops geniculata]